MLAPGYSTHPSTLDGRGLEEEVVRFHLKRTVIMISSQICPRSDRHAVTRLALASVPFRSEPLGTVGRAEEETFSLMHFS